MKKLYALKPLWAFGLFAFLDIICIGMGMGVPIFCILFGFLVGCFSVKYLSAKTLPVPMVIRKVLWYATATAGFTMLAMVVLWAPMASMLFNPGSDLANFGIPMILYEPRASFIGWIVLMIFISPFLQLLTTIFGAYLALLGWMGKENISQTQSM
jgi:hypothetical protein